MKRQQRTLELLHSMCSEQLSQRVKLGDQLDVPRDIDHTAYFFTRADAAAAAAELTAAGYVVTFSRKGFGGWLLEAHITTDIEWETVEAFMPELFELIVRSRGIYDGWGGPVVLKGSS